MDILRHSRQILLLGIQGQKLISQTHVLILGYSRIVPDLLRILVLSGIIRIHLVYQLSQHTHSPKSDTVGASEDDTLPSIQQLRSSLVRLNPNLILTITNTHISTFLTHLISQSRLPFVPLHSALGSAIAARYSLVVTSDPIDSTATRSLPFPSLSDMVQCDPQPRTFPLLAAACTAASVPLIATQSYGGVARVVPFPPRPSLVWRRSHPHAPVPTPSLSATPVWRIPRHHALPILRCLPPLTPPSQYGHTAASWRGRALRIPHSAMMLYLLHPPTTPGTHTTHSVPPHPRLLRRDPTRGCLTPTTHLHQQWRLLRRRILSSVRTVRPSLPPIPTHRRISPAPFHSSVPLPHTPPSLLLPPPPPALGPSLHRILTIPRVVHTPGTRPHSFPPMPPSAQPHHPIPTDPLGLLSRLFPYIPALAAVTGGVPSVPAAQPTDPGVCTAPCPHWGCGVARSIISAIEAADMEVASILLARITGGGSTIRVRPRPLSHPPVRASGLSPRLSPSVALRLLPLLPHTDFLPPPQAHIGCPITWGQVCVQSGMPSSSIPTCALRCTTHVLGALGSSACDTSHPRPVWLLLLLDVLGACTTFAEDRDLRRYRVVLERVLPCGPIQTVDDFAKGIWAAYQYVKGLPTGTVHLINSLTAGYIAQEAIKLITKQYLSDMCYQALISPVNGIEILEL